MDLLTEILRNKNSSCRAVHREPDMQELFFIELQKLYGNSHPETVTRR